MVMNKTIIDYCMDLSGAADPILEQIERETQLQVLMPRMVSGRYQGQVLTFLSHLIQPTLIVEIGSFTGYSALCLVKGLKAGGRLITIEKNPELETRLIKNFNLANEANRIDLIIGSAQNKIELLPDEIDLVFIDADKENNDVYFELLLPKLRSGGLMIVDNVLWSGKVVEKDVQTDKATQAIDTFNRKVGSDQRVRQLFLPIRDGLLLIQKI